MQKSNLGISFGLFGAIFFFACFFGGYIPAVIIGGYILLSEDNLWLKRMAVKGIVLMVAFSLVSALVALIPNFFTFIQEIVTLFDGSFYASVVYNIMDVIESALYIVEKLLFILLGAMALKQRTVRIPGIDSFIDRYM